MLRACLFLLVPLALAAGLWFLLPSLLPDLEPSPRGCLAAGLALLLSAGLTMVWQARQVTTLRHELNDLRHSFHGAEQEMLWARRELQSLIEALRARSATQVAQPERALNEARAEVKLLQSVVTQLEGPQTPAAVAPETPEIALRRADTPERKSTGGASTGGSTSNREIDRLDSKSALTAVRDALKHDRIELVLQPIVSLPQRRRRFYECFSRLRDAEGRTLLPKTYITVAERAGLIAAIDNMLLLRCIQLVRRIQRKGERAGFICNLSPNTLKDAEFFGDFVDYLDANVELAPSLIFEMNQTDFNELAPEAEDYLLRLWHLGAGLSIDGVQDLSFDPAKLGARHVGLIKISADALLGTSPKAVAKLRQGLAEADIDLIVERIESDAQLVELLELGIDYGQGYLFGEPRPAREAA
ncbi:EAL domain-containing protein [Algihabitans albus]|uniref:EAL domain-containing protein n=1 Tax=Algihabitans albus TaxID=2164067 RepID=UPI000E5C7635|nr:EAL domain-containing protein [Algihabitans albus]